MPAVKAHGGINQQSLHPGDKRKPSFKNLVGLLTRSRSITCKRS